MTFSMTGYGKSVVQFKGRALTIELRSLNSKQGDINVRMPSVYRERELELRDLISSRLQRGKIDLSIQRDLAEGETTNEVNHALITSYFKLLKDLEKELDAPSANSSAEYLNLIFQLPDVLKPVSDQLDDAEYEALLQGLDDCLSRLEAFRAQEGAKLETVLREGVENIQSLLADVAPFEAERIARIKQRISGNLSDESDTPNFDKDRFEQELIYYLEKLDITEEKVRLKAHCEYFLKTLVDEAIKGKKLSFIAQEMGREINTLGSKAQHSEMQRLVVGMKDELEKIKEQVLNVL
jgi:uncharacterized protein (TIGR00255 family)